MLRRILIAACGTALLAFVIAAIFPLVLLGFSGLSQVIGDGLLLSLGVGLIGGFVWLVYELALPYLTRKS